MKVENIMREQTLIDGTETFTVSVRESQNSSILVLFAVGAGGNPERHVTLLESLAQSGCTVLAPHFQRLVSLTPTEEELMLRSRRISLTLNAFAKSGSTVVGIGHSIGAATLIALAGGQMWLGPGRRVNISADTRLNRIALLAPPTGFFQAPRALDEVKVPMSIWVGSEDDITPPSQTEWLAQEMHDSHSIDIHVVDGAGHFSFMDQIPPHVVEPLENKQLFLQELSGELCKFVK